MRRLPVVLVLTAVLACASCATYQDDLARGERAFEASEHERALAIFRSLEPDTSRLTEPERAHYAYLRGMTDYRIGYKAEARHWLSIAAALEQKTPSSLPAEWTQRMTESLKDLNEEVYAGGVASLTNSAEAKVKAPDDTASDADADAPKPAAKPAGAQ